MINESAIKAYFFQNFPQVLQVHIRKLGSGVQGSGFLIDTQTPDGVKSYVIKMLLSEGLGHDYPSDRASVFLLDLDEYNNLPKHVNALDVLSEKANGSIQSIGGGKEYYLLMEKAEGENYFSDLVELSLKKELAVQDKEKIQRMAAYLAEIHSTKRDSKALYWRKLRDTVGHGECLMGVFDTYPESALDSHQMAEIVKKTIDRVYRLKPNYRRLSQIHGDFHPGNIWFREDLEFVLLDRSRGPWGEPADDITALTINYIFFSIKKFGDVQGPYLEGLQLFFDKYVNLTGDTKLFEVVAPFFAFRGAVVANPTFYPELTSGQRDLLIRFIHNVLDDHLFRIKKINDYLR